MLPPPPSPLERIDHPAARAAGVALYCKRDDRYTLAPATALQGNKVRKLLPVLEKAAREPGLLHFSFGGAYSNHLAALAAAVRHGLLRAVCFVRGREVDNPLLRYAAASGLDLRRLSRSDYRRRNEAAWLVARKKELARDYGLPLADVRLIPEGGTTPAGVLSCGKALRETTGQLESAPDYFCLSAGTGGTAAGIIAAATPATRVEVFPALRGDWMKKEIEKFLPPAVIADWAVVGGYHFGGYGKFPAAWSAPSPGLATRAAIGEPGLPPLEPIYTAKLFSGVLDRLRRGAYPAGSRLVVLHTGGIY